MPPSITIEQLHAATSEYVRRAATSRSPIVITDRGRPIAVLTRPGLVFTNRRRRTLLPDFQKMMDRGLGPDISADLDVMRGDR